MGIVNSGPFRFRPECWVRVRFAVNQLDSVVVVAPG